MAADAVLLLAVLGGRCCALHGSSVQVRLWAGRGRAALVRKALAKVLANALAQA
jgi:hypothetical protein